MILYISCTFYHIRSVHIKFKFKRNWYSPVYIVIIYGYLKRPHTISCVWYCPWGTYRNSVVVFLKIFSTYYYNSFVLTVVLLVPHITIIPYRKGLGVLRALTLKYRVLYMHVPGRVIYPVVNVNFGKVDMHGENKSSEVSITFCKWYLIFYKPYVLRFCTHSASRQCPLLQRVYTDTVSLLHQVCRRNTFPAQGSF